MWRKGNWRLHGKGAFTLVSDLSPRAVATAPVVALTYAVPSCLWEYGRTKGWYVTQRGESFYQGKAESRNSNLTGGMGQQPHRGMKTHPTPGSNCLEAPIPRVKRSSGSPKRKAPHSGQEGKGGAFLQEGVRAAEMTVPVLLQLSGDLAYPMLIGASPLRLE